MWLACQDNLVPGQSWREKLDHLARCGFDGIEVHGAGLLEDAGDLASALRGHPVRMAAICAGYRGNLLAPDREERERAVADIRTLLAAAARLEAAGLIAVPIFARAPLLPDLSPWKSPWDLEGELLAVLWAQLSEHARRLGTCLILEPINRYLTHRINRLDQAAAFLDSLGCEGTALMADLYHMNIEEAGIPETLRRFGHRLAYVHLADNNRLPPGWGHLDFGAAFRALRASGYRGWLALECRLPEGDPLVTLRHAAGAIRRLWEEA